MNVVLNILKKPICIIVTSVMLFLLVFSVTLSYVSEKNKIEKINTECVETISKEALKYAASYNTPNTESGVLLNPQQSEELASAVSNTVSKTITSSKLDNETLDELESNITATVRIKMKEMNIPITEDEVKILSSGLQAVTLTNIYKILDKNSEVPVTMKPISDIYQYVAHNDNSANYELIQSELKERIDEHDEILAKQATDINSTITELASAIDTVTNENSSNTQDLSSLETSITEIQNNLTKIQTEKTENTTNSLTKEEMEKIQSEITVLKETVEALKVSSTTTDNTSVVTDLQETIKKIEKQIKDETLSDEDLTALSNQLSSLKTSVTSSLATHTKSIAEAEKTIDTLSTDLTSNITKLNNMETNTTTALTVIQDNLGEGSVDGRIADLCTTMTESINGTNETLTRNMTVLGQNITGLSTDVENLESSQQLLSDAQEAMNDALAGKISSEDALAKINESIGKLDGYGSVAEKISAIVTQLEGADESMKQEALQEASSQIDNLKSSMEEQMAKDKKALEYAQATLASKTELDDVASDITTIIGDIGADTTISKELATVNKNLEDTAKKITDDTTSALTALQSETEADLSSLTSGQTTLQDYINSLGTGSENDVLKEKLQAIEDARAKAVEDAKTEATNKVSELSNNLSSEIESINKALDDANGSIAQAKSDLKAEILKQVGELEESTGQDLTDLKNKLENDDITLQSYIDSLEDKDMELKGNLETISTSCNAKLNSSDLAGKINEMLTEDGSIGTEIATKLGAVRSALETSIVSGSEEAKQAAIQAAATALDSAKTALDEKIAGNKTLILSVDGKVDATKTALDEAKNSLTQSLATLSTGKADVSTVNEISDKVTAVESDKASKEEVNSVVSDIQTNKANKSDVEGIKSEIDGKIDSLGSKEYTTEGTTSKVIIY